MGKYSGEYSKIDVSKAIRKSEKQLKSLLIKPSKKSFGIYYTPDFIVHHIAKNAINQALINRINASLSLKKQLKTLSELEKQENKHIAEITINEILPSFYVCDIAMGWGVFLLHSFDILFDIYERLFTKHKDIAYDYNLDSSGNPLSIKEYIIKQIILNNIYGVDLSEESVVLARLKLIEKAIQITEKNEIKLPKINFVAGNCLTGNVFSSKQKANKNRDFTFIQNKTSDISEKYKQRVKQWLNDQKLIHWFEIYPAVIKSGGFDVIIGNPPYINVKRLEIEERRFFSKFYKTYNSNGDISNIFWERSINLCKNGGIIAFITPRYWLEGCDSSSLRDFILNKSIIKEIIDFRSNRTIFKQTEDVLGIDTAIITIQKGNPKENIFNLRLAKDNLSIKQLDYNRFRHLKSKQTSLTRDRWIFEKPSIISEIEERATFLLGDDKKNKQFEGICEIGKGCSTGNNKIFRLSHISDNIFEGVNGEKLHLEDNEIQVLRLLIKNSHIHRYWWERKNQYWIFLKDKNIDDFPNISSYLEKHKMKLEKSKEKYSLKNYYDYAAYRSLSLINKTTKIISPYQATKNKFAIVTNQIEKTINEADVITLSLKDNFAKKINWFYLLTILNSDIIHYYIKYMNKKIYNLYDFRSNQIANIPIIETSNQETIQRIAEFLIYILSRRVISSNNTFQKLPLKVSELLNCIIYEIYFKNKISTSLLNLMEEKIAHLFTKHPSKGEEDRLAMEFEEIIKDKKLENTILKIEQFSGVKEIKKDLKHI